MLGGSQYGKGIPHALPLQTLDIGCCQLLDDLVILAETLVCPAPTNIQRDGNGGGKVPVDAGCCQLLGCGTPDTVNQVWVARSSQADGMRVDRRGIKVGVAVDRGASVRV